MKICFRIACLSPLLLMGLSCGSGDKPDVYAISIPNLHVDSSSSIVALELNINAGSVLAVQNIPISGTATISKPFQKRQDIPLTLKDFSLAASE